jgi:cytochrome b561
MKAVSRYSKPAVWLHWIVAAAMLVNVALGLYADAAPEDWVRPIIDTHKSIGITVLGLAVLRLSWRLSHPPPPLPKSFRPWERSAAHAAHGLLYVLVFALPLTGWAHDSAWDGYEAHPHLWFGLFPVPRIGLLATLDPDDKKAWHDWLGDVHVYAGYALYALLALHILGALKHQFFDREPELQRMSLYPPKNP